MFICRFRFSSLLCDRSTLQRKNYNLSVQSILTLYIQHPTAISVGVQEHHSQERVITEWNESWTNREKDRKPNIKEYTDYTSHTLTTPYTSPPCFLNSSFSFFSAIFRLRSLLPIVAITDVSSTFFTHTSIRAVFPFITYEIPQMLFPLGSRLSPIVLSNTLNHLSSRIKSFGRTPKRYASLQHASLTQLPPFTLFSSSHDGVIPFYTQNNHTSLTLK